MNYQILNQTSIFLFFTLILLVISQKIYFSRTTYKSIFHKLVLLILGTQTIISFMSLLIFSDKFYVLNLTNNSNGFEVISFLFDKVSIVMLSFISFIGLCVYKYSLNYLDKEVGHEKFLQSLILAIIASTLLVLSANLILFSISWIILSLSLHLLLEHYNQRERAIIAARKKFIISRVGDVFLIIAIYILSSHFKTIDLITLFEFLETATDKTSIFYLNLAGISIVFAAILKSTQFPFHSWLPDTLEAPTPVSALMHAGIVNGGGFLLIRLSPIFENTTLPLYIALVFGLVTTCFGIFCMWGQTSIKKKLAWSTVGQMGFMIFQCGLGAFSLALIHIIGHGFYKAHAFLTSGEFNKFEEALIERESPKVIFGRYLVSFIFSSILILSTLLLFQVDIENWPGGTLSLLVLVLALSNLLVNKFKYKKISISQRLINFILILLLTIFIEEIAKSNFSASLGNISSLEDRGGFGIFLWIISGISLITLNFLALISTSSFQSNLLKNAKYHALNGFYIGLYADRFTKHIWPIRKIKLFEN